MISIAGAVDPVDEICAILIERGGAEYGDEHVTQLAHALQCAQLAEAAGASPALIAAALLHDIGHLVHDLGRGAAERGIDDGHEVRASDWLDQYFGEDVTGPVRLHVDAKRYLTATDPKYFALLSEGSVRSLALQGGPFSRDLAEGFIALPHAAAAVSLRRWDEAAKVPGKTAPGLEHFRPNMAASLRAVG